MQLLKMARKSVQWIRGPRAGMEVLLPNSTDAMQPLKVCYEPLPPALPVVPYPGLERKLEMLLNAVSCTSDPNDNDWVVLSPDGRRLRMDGHGSKPPTASPGLICLMGELRVTMNGGPIAFAIQTGSDQRIWHRKVDAFGRTTFHPIASIEAEFGIPASEHMKDLDEFVRHNIARIPEALLMLGVKFANTGIARTFTPKGGTTIIVHPDDPRFDMIWALDLSHIPFDNKRARRFRWKAVEIVDGPEAAEQLARIFAAPVCQPYMHGFGRLIGPGGTGKGLTLRALRSLYGPLAVPFSLAALLCVSRSSSTTNDQAAVGLLTALLAYDSDAVDPGQGLVENLKKAATGEELTIRLLQQNVTSNRVTAFMVIATNRNSTLPSTPEWERRVWNVPFRADNTERKALGWARYLGDGSDPDDGIYDAIMCGALSFALGRPDPVTVSKVTEGLTLYGKTVRDLLMSCGPLQKNGLPDKARVPVSVEELRGMRVTEKERSSQLALMGLGTASMRDVHGDGKTRQCVFIKDSKRFEPFAAEWRAQHAVNEAEKAAEEAEAAAEAAAEERSHKELISTVRAQLLAPVLYLRLDPSEQIKKLQEIENLSGWILIPAPTQWSKGDGKGITAKWRTDPSIRHDLKTFDPKKAPNKYGFSAGDGFLIIDCDAPKDGAACADHGLDSLAKIPGITLDDFDTLALRSAHGLHLVWRLPDDLVGHVKASTHVHGTNVDLRPGGRSYVLGPGSSWTTDDGRRFEYPGIVKMPPSALPDRVLLSGRALRIPMLPAPIRDWIQSDPKCLDGVKAEEPVSRPEPPSPMPVRNTRGGKERHIEIPPMTPGNTHDVLRDTAARIAGIAGKYGWPRERLDAEMDRLRAAVPAAHDSQDTEELIDSAIRKYC